MDFRTWINSYNHIRPFFIPYTSGDVDYVKVHITNACMNEKHCRLCPLNCYSTHINQSCIENSWYLTSSFFEEGHWCIWYGNAFQSYNLIIYRFEKSLTLLHILISSLTCTKYILCSTFTIPNSTFCLNHINPSVTGVQKHISCRGMNK